MKTKVGQSLVLGPALAVLTSCSDAPAPTQFLLSRDVSANLTGLWVTRAPLLTARNQMTAAAIEGKIVVTDGGRAFPTFYRTTEVYDPASNSWSAGASSSTARVFTSTNNAALNGVLYVVGGNPVGFCSTLMEAYTLATNSWAVRASTPRERCGGGAIAYAGRVFVLGGVNTSSSLRPVEIDAYDPVTNSWTVAGSLPGWHSVFGAAVLNDRLYVVGGDNGTCTSGGMAFDFATNTWTAITPMSTIRCQPAVATAGGRLYAIGGYDYSGNIHATVESYDPVTNSWRPEPPLSSPRYGAAAVTLNGTLYVIGGYDGFDAVNIVEALTPVAANSPPIADAGADQRLECVDGKATAALNGGGSRDPDGTIRSFRWLLESAVIAEAMTVSVPLPPGAHVITLDVTDDDGASARDALTVHVVDSRAPVIQLVETKNVPWPPNRRMVHVASISATDECDGVPVVEVAVSSTEAIRGPRRSEPDWEIRRAANGTLDVYVRAERNGNGTGRVYRIDATSSDRAGNVARATALTSVPHDSRK